MATPRILGVQLWRQGFGVTVKARYRSHSLTMQQVASKVSVVSLSFFSHMRFQIKELILLLLSMALLILSNEQVVMSPRPPSIKRIDEDMDVDQGYDVNLRRPEKFGKRARM